jgi:uncharacterized protein (TIGR00369 family)
MTRYTELIEGWLAGRIEPAVARLVGFRLTGWSDGVARMEMEADARHHNPMGIVHGGILCDLADAAMGVAFAASLAEGERFGTLQLSASFLRPVRAGRLVATARLLHRSRGAGHLEAEIADAEGRVVARFASTCLAVAAAPAEGDA